MGRKESNQTNKQTKLSPMQFTFFRYEELTKNNPFENYYAFGPISVERQPQNPEFRIIPENSPMWFACFRYEELMKNNPFENYYAFGPMLLRLYYINNMVEEAWSLFLAKVIAFILLHN